MKALCALLLALSLAAHADTAHDAQQAAIADVATTGIGLALGAAEANPLGIATLPLKLIALDYADKLPTGERETLQSAIASVWTGASVNNVCVILALVTGGAFGAGCIVAGLAVAVGRWTAGEQEREFWQICADYMRMNPALVCTYTPT